MNIADFLNPISDAEPCGKYLCYDHVYDQIKELRREDDPQLSQGICTPCADLDRAFSRIQDALLEYRR